MDDLIMPGDDADTGSEVAIVMEGGLAARMAREELNMHIATAHQYPRSVSRAVQRILSLVQMDAQTAEECIYVLKRDNKPLRGPSIRLAEIVASQWGNCHTGSRIIAVDREEKVVIAEGVFWDLESGTKRTTQVRRRISTRDGRLFSEDMIVVTGNAAGSIALREAILRGIPKPIWRQAYDAAETVLRGDAKTLAERRGLALKAWADLGISEAQVFAFLEVGGLDDIQLDHLATLRAMLRAIQAQEAEVKTYFPEGPAPKVPPGRKAPQEAPQPAQEAAPPAAAPKGPSGRKGAPAPAPEPVEEPPAEEVGPAEGAIDWEAFAGEVLDNALAGGVAAARSYYADRLAQMELQAPLSYAELAKELADYEAAEGEGSRATEG